MFEIGQREWDSNRHRQLDRLRVSMINVSGIKFLTQCPEYGMFMLKNSSSYFGRVP